MSEARPKLSMVSSLGAMRGVQPEDCVNLKDKCLVVRPGEVMRLCDLEGPGRIVRIWFTTPRLGRRHVLRDVVWRMFWDGEEQPSVECPLGDLFGAAFGQPHRLVSDRLVVAGGACICRFEMPFRSRAVVEIHNQSDKHLRNFFFQISYYREASAPADLATFHAQWRRENPTVPTRPFSILQARGKGRYVGVKIDMQNRSWWLKPPLAHIVIPRGFGIGLLEGWESVRVDGETPGIVGTGGEDYFGGGFYFTGGAFSTPTHGAMVRSYLTGRVAAYRLHIDDPVPFDESIDVTIDHGFRNQLEGDFCCVAYWYQQEPHASLPPLPSVEGRRPSLPWMNVVQHIVLTLVALLIFAGVGTSFFLIRDFW